MDAKGADECKICPWCCLYLFLAGAMKLLEPHVVVKDQRGSVAAQLWRN
jgi:hypothetical protein